MSRIGDGDLHAATRIACAGDHASHFAYGHAIARPVDASVAGQAAGHGQMSADSMVAALDDAVACRVTDMLFDEVIPRRQVDGEDAAATAKAPVRAAAATQQDIATARPE